MFLCVCLSIKDNFKIYDMSRRGTSLCSLEGNKTGTALCKAKSICPFNGKNTGQALHVLSI